MVTLKTNFMKLSPFYSPFSVVVGFVFLLNLLTLLHFIAYLSAVELSEARQQCCTEEHWKKPKELEKHTCTQNRESPTQKQLEMEFNEMR